MKERTMRITLEGRNFVIQKMSAAKGYAVLVEIMTKALPLDLLSSALSEFLPSYLLNLEKKQQMSMEEFEALQLKLMQCVSEELKAGSVPVVDNKGCWQVEDLEEDMLLFGQLLVKTLVFQYKDFFTGILGKLGITLEDTEELQQKLVGSLSGFPTSQNISTAQ